jgi:hypothetical protein
MFGNVKLTQLASPTLSDQPAKGSRRVGKKLFVLIATVIVVAVIAGALLIPQGAASIPLNVNYTVGEKMVYNTSTVLSLNVDNSTIPLSSLSSANITVSGTETVEVLSFDGEFYTLNVTSALTQGSIPFTSSIIQKMNKTGYSTFLVNLGSTSEALTGTSFASNQPLAQLLSKPEVKVGDSVTIPYSALMANLANLSSSIQVTGDLTLTFKGFQDLTVPAGTYKVFEVDLTSNNLSTTISLPSYGNSTTTAPNALTMDMNMTCQSFMEYNTMRQIQSSMQETSTIQSSAMNYTMTTALDVTLNQDIIP